MKITRFSVFLSCTSLLSPATSYAVSSSETPRIISGERDVGVHYAGDSRLVKDTNSSNGSAAMLASMPLPRIVRDNYKNLVLDTNIPRPFFWDGEEADPLTVLHVTGAWKRPPCLYPLPCRYSHLILF